jgi:hypothetical protein
MAMAWFAFGEDRPGGDVEGGKESGGAMANIVMSNSFHVAQAHRCLERHGIWKAFTAIALGWLAAGSMVKRAPIFRGP